jgi:hypothetical protein
MISVETSSSRLISHTEDETDVVMHFVRWLLFHGFATGWMTTLEIIA